MKISAINIDDTQRVDCHTGYQHPLYADALSEFGEPLPLDRSKGWMLKRRIPGTSWFDAIGCYPFFSSRNWEALSKDIDSLQDSCITVTMVTDPFGPQKEADLKAVFRDHLIRFKRHHVIDLSKHMESYVCRHHRRNALKALTNVSVELCDRPELFVDRWQRLYGHLIQKHAIKGMLTFSKNSFMKMLRVPGVTMFRAIAGQQTVCMQIWYEQDDIAYYHLGASDACGYKLKSAFALFWTAINHFSDKGLKWIGLGSGAGLRDAQEDGLSRFKKGWANAYRYTYLGGRVLNPDLYQRMCRIRGGEQSNYFPSYRQGEF